VILGTIGYWKATPDPNFTTALFQSVQLFVLEGGVVDGDTPWQLEVARFLAPAVLGYAAIRGVLLVTRDQVAVWRTRLFARGHVVVVGTSASALAISADLLADGRHVVVLAESGELNSHHGLGERGATVLSGNGTDPVVLARARPDRASDVIVAPGLDTTAIQGLAASASPRVRNTPRPITASRTPRARATTVTGARSASLPPIQPAVAALGATVRAAPTTTRPPA